MEKQKGKLINFYVMRIKKGHTTLDAVPEILREEVELALNKEKGGD